MTGNTYFGLQLKKLRKAKGFTQEKLAEAIGVEPQTISRIESGSNFTSIPNLIKIANALKVNLKYLFDIAEINYSKETLLAIIIESLPKLEFNDLEAIYNLIIHLEYKNNQNNN